MTYENLQLPLALLLTLDGDVEINVLLLEWKGDGGQDGSGGWVQSGGVKILERKRAIH